MRFVAGLVIILVALGGVVAWAVTPPEIAPIAPPSPSSFPADLVERGEMLAEIGDCAVCHTRPGGEPYSGGLALETPFGVIYTTNITPDPEKGIGAWSLAAFKRAMHQGVARSGTHLYPAFPYDHFTKVRDEDIEALYVYLMSVDPVDYSPPGNELRFPYNLRFLLAFWNFLFLDDKRFEPDPARSEEWNRGAYLAEGLGHCGACHSPRNSFGAVDGDHRFSGGEVEGWHVPALDGSSPAPVPWTADGLVNYFLDGWDEDHGIAAGPMTPVVNALAALSEEDAYALAEYVLSFQNQSDIEERTDAAQQFAESREFGSADTPANGPENLTDPSLRAGLAIFQRTCVNCHRYGTRSVPLALTSTVNAPDPVNVIRIIQNGIQPPEAANDRSMPAFGNGLTDEDMVNLVTFVRFHFSQNGPWQNVEERVREVRHSR